MNEYSEDFKGVRFPRNLWLDRSISFVEKSILVVVKNLDKSDDHCRATNNYLADFLQCSVPTITRAIAHLKELGYVEETEEWKVGVCRRLRLKIDIEGYPNQNDYTPNQNDYTPNQNDEGVSSKWLDPLIKMIRDPNQNDEGPSSKWLPNNIYNNINNNIYNNIGENKNFSNADASPIPTGCDVETGLIDVDEKKTKRKTKKQQRYDEVLSSTEFNDLLHNGITEERDIKEIDTLWSEFVDLRCSKDYKAFTDWAVKRNLKILNWTSIEERKAILEKSVAKWWTWLFPLNDYDKQRIKEKSISTEWSDEWLVKQIYDTSCKEREDEIPNWTTHNLIMDLCNKYWEDKIRALYYEKVKPQVDSKYSIKRDWIK